MLDRRFTEINLKVRQSFNVVVRALVISGSVHRLHGRTRVSGMR